MKKDLISKFLTKLLILTFILLLVVVLDRYSIIKWEDIKTQINGNINFVEVIKKVNGEFNLINLQEEVVSVSKTDELLFSQNENTSTYYKKTNEVYSKTLGSAIKISKDKNNLYSVTILDENNNLLEYKCLSDINIKLYQIVKKGEEIGGASLINDSYNDYYYYYLLTLNES